MKVHVIWFCVAFACLVLGGFSARKEIQVVEKPVEVIRTKEVIVEKPVEVIREIPKELEKPAEAKIPASTDIPQNAVLAELFFLSYSAARAFEKNEVLRGLLSVNVVATLGDNLKSAVSANELKETVEIALRKHGVPVSDSGKTLLFELSGQSENGTCAFSASLSLLEDVNLLRPGGFRAAVLPVWHLGQAGLAGQSRLGEEANFAAEKLAGSFATAYLSMNAK